MSTQFWLSDEQVEQLRPHFPKARNKPRADHRRVLSDILHALRNGLRWQHAPAVYSPHKTRLTTASSGGRGSECSPASMGSNRGFSRWSGASRTDGATEGLAAMGIGTLIGWLIVGAIAGWIAEKIMGRNDSLIMNIVIGIIGAIVGGWLFSLLFGRSLSAESGWIWSILVSVIGAVILLWIVGMIRGRRT